MSIVQYIPRRNITPPFTTIKYGILYNWYVTQDVRLISSSNDWIVPSFSDFTTLITNTASAAASSRLMEAGTAYWTYGVGTNNYLFNARGAGGRFRENDSVGGFTGQKTSLYLWSSYAGVQPGGMLRLLDGTPDGTAVISFTNFKYTGYSIRLLYTGVGIPTEYTGNDGKKYRVITIGGQTWMADNLAETEWRDNSPVSEVTDDTAWKALTTSAMCYYNNDSNNM